MTGTILNENSRGTKTISITISPGSNAFTFTSEYFYCAGVTFDKLIEEK